MKYLFFLVSPILIFAQTTMCYKNNWSDLSTIEKQKFDGGECKGELSIEKMKKSGWKVDDIKISTNENNMNFIYVLKKEETKGINKDSLNYDKIASTLEKNKIEKQNQEYLIEGKSLYIKICQSCHGKKGELKAKGTSRPLNTLSLDDMSQSIKDYRLEDYDRGRAFLMKPYTNFATTLNLEKIKVYLDSVNK